MSVHTITTNVIRCDGRNCDESYADVVEVTQVNIVKAALADDWEETASGAFHFCPECSRQRRIRRAARAFQQGIVTGIQPSTQGSSVRRVNGSSSTRRPS